MCLPEEGKLGERARTAGRGGCEERKELGKKKGLLSERTKKKKTR